jgi:hypothetical protein
MSGPRISIVTPSLNQAAFLPRTLESVLSQEGPFELEYVVQDGGSTDGSVELLRRHEGRLDWRSEKDSGQPEAINRGLRRTTGEAAARSSTSTTGPSAAGSPPTRTGAAATTAAAPSSSRTSSRR